MYSESTYDLLASDSSSMMAQNHIDKPCSIYIVLFLTIQFFCQCFLQLAINISLLFTIGYNFAYFSFRWSSISRRETLKMPLSENMRYHRTDFRTGKFDLYHL